MQSPLALDLIKQH